MTESQRNSHSGSLTDTLGRIAVRLILFAAVWFMLTGSDLQSWIFGVPAVCIATLLSLIVSPGLSHMPTALGFGSFVPFFLRQSSLSGIDVMRRALSPRLAVNPGLVSYTTNLPEGAPRIFFVNTISLLPGTLSADLHDNTVIIHTIDKNLPIWANIQNLEGRISVLFRVRGSRKKRA